MNHLSYASTNANKGLSSYNILPKSQRRIFTAYNDQIPDTLSYQSIKLANFIELQLADLQDSVACLSKDNFNNQAKQVLSRSYNTVHEMEFLFQELNLKFLYSQIKKLVRSFGELFLKMMNIIEDKQKSIVCERVKQQEKEQLILSRKNSKINLSFKHNNKENEEIVKSKGHKLKGNKKLRGVHLYNENYARFIEFDVQKFKEYQMQIKKNAQTKQIEQEEKKKQQQIKFKKELFAELADNSYIIPEEEKYAQFYIRQKQLDERLKNISLTDELTEIAKFFRESENQALSFLKQTKSRQEFHHLTEGFNEAVEIFIQEKNERIQNLRIKIQQLLSMLQKKDILHETVIKQKDLYIKQLIENKGISTNTVFSVQTQTYQNYDEQMKELYLRNFENEKIIEEQKNYFLRTLEEQKREADQIFSRLASKELQMKKLRDSYEEKIEENRQYEKKLKRIVELNLLNNKQLDPLIFFRGLSREQKKTLILQARQEGIFHGFMNENQERVKIAKKTKLPTSGIHFEKQNTFDAHQIPQSSNRFLSEFFGMNHMSQNRLSSQYGRNSHSRKRSNSSQKQDKQMEEERSDKKSIKQKEINNEKRAQINELKDTSTKKMFKINKNLGRQEIREKKPPVFDLTIPMFIPKKVESLETKKAHELKNNILITKILQSFKSQKKIESEEEDEDKLANSQKKIPRCEFSVQEVQQILGSHIGSILLTIKEKKEQKSDEEVEKTDFKSLESGLLKEQEKEEERLRGEKRKKSWISKQFQINISNDNEDRILDQKEGSSKRDEEGKQNKNRYALNKMKTSQKEKMKAIINSNKLDSKGESKEQKDRFNENYKNNYTVYKSRQILQTLNTSHQKSSNIGLYQPKDNATSKTHKKIKTQEKEKEVSLNKIQFVKKNKKQAQKSNHHSSKEINRLLKELGEESLIKVAKQAGTNEQFKKKAQQIHLQSHQKCENNCKHLQRFMMIYINIRKEMMRQVESNERKVLKCGVQNFNQTFSVSRNLKISKPLKSNLKQKLPTLTKK